MRGMKYLAIVPIAAATHFAMMRFAFSRAARDWSATNPLYEVFKFPLVTITEAQTGSYSGFWFAAVLNALLWALIFAGCLEVAIRRLRRPPA